MEFNEEGTLAIGDTTKVWLDEILQERINWLNDEVYEESFDNANANNETLEIIVSCNDCRDEQLRLKVGFEKYTYFIGHTMYLTIC